MSDVAPGPKQLEPDRRNLQAVASSVDRYTKLPPHSVEAEQGVLSSILQSPRETIAQCIAKIGTEYFYVPAHRTLYQELLDLWEAGKAIELITFTQHLRDRKLLESVGGAAFITTLQTFAPTSAAISHYLDIVREKHIRREAIATYTEAVRRLHDEQDDDLSALDAAEAMVASIRSVHGSNGAHGFTMRSPDEILALPRDPHANYMGDRVQAKGQSLVMAGIGDLGKSRANLQQKGALILGRPWCGLETHAKGIKCVVFQAENINHRLQDDLEAIKRWAGKDWKLIETNLLIHTLERDRDLLVSLGDPQNVREMQSIVRQYDPGIVDFDSVYNFGIGDLNKDTDMAATCLAMSRIAHVGNPDRALCMVHHALTGREGAKKAFGFERSGFARNSKVIFQFARAQINVVPGNDDYSVLLLFCGKNNNGKAFDPVAVRLDPGTMIYEVAPDFDIEGWKAQIMDPKKGRQTYSPQIVAEIDWPKPELDKKQLAKAIEDETGCSPATAYRLIDAAVTQGLIRFSRQTKIYAKK